jgi:hypothetical protein
MSERSVQVNQQSRRELFFCSRLKNVIKLSDVVISELCKKSLPLLLSCPHQWMWNEMKLYC